MTIVPRTGPFSASSALAMTSWYHPARSVACETSTVVMAPPHARGSRGRLTRTSMRAVDSRWCSYIVPSIGWDVLVDVEQVRRVIASFDCREPFVGVRGIGLMNPSGPLIAKEADVDAVYDGAHRGQGVSDPRLKRSRLSLIL